MNHCEKVKRFLGKYRTFNEFPNKTNEIVTLNVTTDSTYTDCSRIIFETNSKVGSICVPLTFNKNTYFRWDLSLINENEGKSLFGFPTQNAQVFTRIGPFLIRRVYQDYAFKGPFGGYWFSSTKDFYIWRISK